jgi:HipA-like protein
MSKRGLYPTLSSRNSAQQVREIMNLISFCDGEHSLLDIAEKNWKINYKDRMGLLLTCCKDCIGAVSVEKNEEL